MEKAPALYPEKVTYTQEFRPFVRSVLRRKKEVLLEALKPCSRFKAVFKGNRDLDIKISSLMHRFDVFEDDACIEVSGMPMNWRFLIEYLQACNITVSPDLFFRALRNDAPHIAGVRLAPAPHMQETDGHEVIRYGFGSGETLDESISKAVGEQLERYFLTLYRQKDLVFGTYKDLLGRGKHVLNIHSLNGYLPWQKEMFPQFKSDEQSSFGWVSGVDLFNKKAILLPAQCVFWNYKLDTSINEKIITQQNTNGTAGYFTKEEAMLSGIYELIERDGFLIYWLNAISPKKIDVASVSNAAFQDKLEGLRRCNIEYYFLDVTTDTKIPACVCVLVGHENESPVIALGASAGMDVYSILRSALGEALSIYSFETPEREPLTLPNDYKPFTDMTIDRDERIHIWRGQEMASRFAFFLAGEMETIEDFIGSTPQNVSAQEQLEYSLKQCKQLGEGYEVYYYEARHEVLTRLGYHVVRVLIPRLVHLYLNEGFATLNASRLHDVPPKLGKKPASVLNPWPHPFP